MSPASLTIPALVAYGLAAWSSVGAMRRQPTRVPWGGLLLAGLALLLHAAVMATLWGDQEWRFGFVRALSLVGWLMALLVVLGSPFSRVRVLLIAALPIAALALVVPVLWPDQTAPASVGDWRIQLHVGLALAAYSVLSLAALQAGFLALTDLALKRRRLDWEPDFFPPLSSMDQMLFQLIGAGFVLLSLTILTGALFIEDWFAQHLIHKTVLTFTAWLTFGALLWGRWRHGWRGQRAVRWTLAGMLLLLLAFFGSKFVLEWILQRY
ncbi:MAG: cytochrome c biogenesis protein CcsA [Xanthomonadales bacterium]|nr:cytochrome c biogenesis protein CcsA [Xanthomonadales bacterium]